MGTVSKFDMVYIPVWDPSPHFIHGVSNDTMFSQQVTKRKNLEGQISIHRVEQDDTDELDDAVESHELKHAERCYEGGPSLPLEGNTGFRVQIKAVLS